MNSTSRPPATDEEARNQALIHAIPDLIFTNRRNGEYLSVHAPDPALLAATPESILHRKIGDVLPPPIAAQCLTAISCVLDSGQIQEITYSFPVGDRLRHFEARIAPCTADTVLTIVRDITERKQGEEELRNSEAKYRLFFESGGDAIYIHDENGRILAANPAASEQLGYSHAELMTMNAGQVDSPEEALHLPERIARLHEQGRLEFGTMHRRKDGSLLPVDVKAKRVDWSGQPAVMSICRDLTERKQADRFLQLVLDNIPDFVFWKDRNSVFLGCNKAVARAAGLDAPDQIVGKTDYDLGWKKEESDFYVAMDRRVMESDQAEYHIIEPQLQADGKQAWLDTCKVPLHDEQGNVIGILGTYTDITERMRAEKEKAKLEADLHQAQKMESIGRLAGGVAHDFNNMLTVILGRVELAIGQMDSAHPVHDDLEEVRKAATRSANLTRQLLAFARRQTIAPEILDLNETIAGMLQMLRRLIGENIDLVWRPAAGLGPVKIDPSQFDQLLTNLCVNARDAISGIGQITIATSAAVVGQADCADPAGSVPGAYVVLSVSDTGCGMDPETRSHVFEPFFTTKSIGKGTGLGLATVYGIVKQNSGFIDVKSEPGRGTIFQIALPRHVDAAKEEPVPPAIPAGPTARGGETLLLVEDEIPILNLTARLIKQLGYTVLAASTPGEAIRLAEEHAGEIHLLMTDVVMPEMNGRDLAKNLLTLYPNLARLFMSGYPANVIAHQGILDQGVHFIQKPFLQQHLAVQIRNALDSALA